MSTLTSRLRWGRLLGQTFGGKRNLYTIFGYPQILDYDILHSKYERQDLVSRIVDMPPEEMWSMPPQIKQGTQPLAGWQDFVAVTQYYDKVIQADKLCAFNDFSILWLGLPGDPRMQVSSNLRLEDILYVQPYGSVHAEIKEIEHDPQNARYGLPTLYEVEVTADQKRSRKVLVHHSRVIHIVDRPLVGRLRAIPRLQQIYNVLEDLLKTVGGSAELYWLTANRGMQVDVDKDMELDVDDAAELSDELDEFQHELRRYIRTRGVKINTLGSEVADPKGVFNVILSVIAGATGIPQRILVGAEAGQLASTQDRANWADFIQRRRSVFGVPYVLIPTLLKLRDLGILPELSLTELNIEWPEAFKMSPLERSQSIAAIARANANLSSRNALGDPVSTNEEARILLGLPREPNSEDTFPDPPDPSASAGGGLNLPNATIGDADDPGSNDERGTKSDDPASFE